MLSVLSFLLYSLLLTHVAGWSKVFVMVFDNHGTSEFMASPAWFAIQARTFVFTTYYAVSQNDSNYMALIYGDTNYDPTGKTITDLAEAYGMTWRAYYEDYQPVDGVSCNMKQTINNYTRDHNPFLSFANVPNDLDHCGKIVDQIRFRTDVASASIAQLSYYFPSVDHSGTNATIGEVGDYFAQWLSVWWDPYPTAWRDTLLVGVFASSGIADDLRVPMFLINPCVPAALTVGEKYNYTHYSLVQYVERIIFPNNTNASLDRQDATAQPITLTPRDCR